MKSLQKEEDLVMQEIMSFPREKLPQVTKLLRLLRREFDLETGLERNLFVPLDHGRIPWQNFVAWSAVPMSSWHENLRKRRLNCEAAGICF